MSVSVGCTPAGQSSAHGSGISMFRWLEVLEKEFDKAFVDVDMLLGEIDPDQVDITYEGRQKMTSLSSCFAQLCHKMQTVFQLNHKLEVSNFCMTLGYVSNIKCVFRTFDRAETILLLLLYNDINSHACCWTKFRLLMQEKPVRGVQDVLKNIWNSREKEERELIFSSVTRI